MGSPFFLTFADRDFDRGFDGEWGPEDRLEQASSTAAINKGPPQVDLEREPQPPDPPKRAVERERLLNVTASTEEKARSFGANIPREHRARAWEFFPAWYLFK